MGGDNNVFVQIGLVVLVGLAAKNAIPDSRVRPHAGGRGRPPCAGRRWSRLRLRRG
ncbi:hypothetical protein ACPA9J_16870 [Pseudomonas aeruginosa]